MNLAYHDVRRHFGRFVGTAFGLGMLFTVVLAMAGIYAGLVEDATSLARTMGADLWVVEHDTRGPFADASRLDPSLEGRVAAIPGVASARSYTYETVQHRHGAKDLRFAILGLSWPETRGESLPLVAGRPLSQSHGEAIADAKLGLQIGESLRLATRDYRIVGLTRGVLTTGGEPAFFLSIADAQLVSQNQPTATIRLERERALARLTTTDLGRSQPGLEAIIVDPRAVRPGLAAPPISAVLVRLQSADRATAVRATIASWGDATVYSQADEERLLLQGVVKRARVQLGLFSIILTITAAVLVAMVIYNMAVDKTRDIAILKLMGSPVRRLMMMVLEQAWLLGILAYGFALLISHYSFPHFARRTVLTTDILIAAPLLVLTVTTLGSVFGIVHALRVDVGQVLEG